MVFLVLCTAVSSIVLQTFTSTRIVLSLIPNIPYACSVATFCGSKQGSEADGAVSLAFSCVQGLCAPITLNPNIGGIGVRTRVALLLSFLIPSLYERRKGEFGISSPARSGPQSQKVFD